VARDLNSAKAANDARSVGAAASTLRAMGETLGLLQQDPGTYLKRSVGPQGLDDAAIEELVSARRAARSDKNFAESDRIRKLLTDGGVLLEDRPNGVTEWRRA